MGGEKALSLLPRGLGTRLGGKGGEDNEVDSGMHQALEQQDLHCSDIPISMVQNPQELSLSLMQVRISRSLSRVLSLERKELSDW